MSGTSALREQFYRLRMWRQTGLNRTFGVQTHALVEEGKTALCQHVQSDEMDTIEVINVNFEQNNGIAPQRHNKSCQLLTDFVTTA